MLQHQQRSSIDTDALDEEHIDHISTPSSPRNLIEKPTISVQSPDALSPNHISPISVAKHQTPQQLLTPRRTTAWRKKSESAPPVPPAESPLPAVVPEVVLSRADSGNRNNTDLSESTTTTDDYITATSGTDSSRRSSSNKVGVRFIPKYISKYSNERNS